MEGLFVVNVAKFKGFLISCFFFFFLKLKIKILRNFWKTFLFYYHYLLLLSLIFPLSYI